MNIEIGTHCMHYGRKWFITDISRSVLTGKVISVDLRLTVIVNPKKRYLDEAITKRNVPANQIQDVAL